jgi:MFS transporter, ACDE family, multidrug resistance protein
MSGSHATSVASPFRQPKAVFAVAFACAVSFMGIGLVDPILPAISHELHASPSEVTLLFTSYLVVTAMAMLITNWVSSRIGAKKTLIAGLILIVVFSAAAGASPTISGIIGFRAGWGVGNALFIATSLAVIVASASGGFAGAIVLYETALGVGIAIGPLLGGTLGEISWRGPFYGVAALMAIALIATIVLVEPLPKPAHTTSLSAPLRALKHRGLLTMSLTALCYNWAFFTVLGYAPFPMELSPIKLGLVFTGWGTFVAIFAVFGAPRLQARLGIAKSMYANLAAFAVVVLVIAIWTTDRAVLIPAVIISGIFIGVNNTITTQAVMTVSPVEKPVASAAYGFVRFIGGGLAPYVAGRLVLAVNIHFPFYIAVGAILLGIGILTTARGLLTQAERVQAEQVVHVVHTQEEAIAGDAEDLWRELAKGRLAALAGRSGVVEDQAEGAPVARAHRAHAVPDRARGPAARAAHRPVPGGEDQPVALLQGDAGAPGLRPRPLLDQEELATGVVRAVLVQADHDLQREHQVAEDVAVQRVPVPAPVAQQDLRALALTGPVAHLHPLPQRVRPRGRAAQPLGPVTGDHQQPRVESLAQLADGFGEVVGEVPVLAGAEPVPGHVDGAAEQLRLVVQGGQVPAFRRAEQPGRAGAALGVEFGRDGLPVGCLPAGGDHHEAPRSAPSWTSSCCLRATPPA